MEEWKDIEWYAGLYQISNFGRVKSFRYGEGKIIKPFINNGYYCVGLSRKDDYKKVRVHRLVAKHFIPNPDNKKEVNHIDGNKLNNNVSNLEWSTRSENIKHAFLNGLKTISEKQIAQCRLLGQSLSKKVLQYDMQDNFIKEWDSTAEAGRQLKINQSNISACCRGKRNNAGGYVWKYKEVEK